MVSEFLKWLLIFTTLSIVNTSVCPQGKQFLHQELQTCVNCTICDSVKGHVVLRPCEVHRDTICGPLSELTLDWKSLQSENRHRHGHRHHHEAKNKKLHINSENEGKREFESSNNKADHTSEVIGLGADVTSTELPFTTAETLVWDWQAIALTLAVFSCILFFLVIALYSLHQAKQWRRLKENFEADVEELSARLSLMATNTNEKGELLEPSLSSPIHDGNYLKNRCVYLEQLLNGVLYHFNYIRRMQVRKVCKYGKLHHCNYFPACELVYFKNYVRKDTKIGSDTGNVYIEESNPNGKT